MTQDDLIVIPLPKTGGGVTFAVARLIEEEDGKIFAEAIGSITETNFAPPRRIALTRYSVAKMRDGAASRPDLYLYEGMILPGPDEGAS